VVDDKTRFTNRLGYALKQYFPQALDWFEHTDTIEPHRVSRRLVGLSQTGLI